MEWVIQYGYMGIFLLLISGIIGLPVPDETIMVFAGYLIFTGKFAPLPTIVAAFLGSITGATFNYCVGRTAGNYLIRRFGNRIELTPDKIEIVHQWFKRMGKLVLIIGYFVPGIRHLTTFVAGTTKLEFPIFAVFAYVGALFWCASYIAIGYYLGENWKIVLQFIDQHLIAVGVLIIVAIAGLIYAYRK